MTGSPAISKKELDRDLACAIAMGFVEAPSVAVTLEAITYLDGPARSVRSDWLDDSDPLHVATRAYLAARREASNASRPRPGGAWENSALARMRDQAVLRALKARQAGLELLTQRGIIERADRMGLRVAKPQ